MDHNPVLVQMQQCGRGVFGGNLSVSRCGLFYTTLVAGELFSWNEIQQGFNLLISVPREDGAVDVVTIPHSIRGKTDLAIARADADRAFRDYAMYPSRAQDSGIWAEDLFLRCCTKLGYLHVNDARPSVLYTVRRGTYLEDTVAKADFIVTMPGPDESQERVSAPLQLTLDHSRGSASKSQAITDNQVAYLPLDLFFGKAGSGMNCMKEAVDGKHFQKWLFGEVLKIVFQRHLGYVVQLPIRVKFEPKYINELSLEVLTKRMVPELQHQVGLILADARQSKKARHSAVAGLLDDYNLSSPTWYPCNTDMVEFTGW
jgi:hypothetical protein